MQQKYFPEIDRLRGVAILMVIWHHLAYFDLSRFVGSAFRETWAGVDLFFVISGFVIYRSLRGRGVGEFYCRRFWRIAPLAVLWTLLPLAAVAIFGAHSPAIALDKLARGAGEILTLRFNYSSLLGSETSFLYAPFWSLCVEEHFYLLLPWLLLLVTGKQARIALCLALIALTVLVFRPLSPSFFPQSHAFVVFRLATQCRLDALFLGVLLSEWAWRMPEVRRGWMTVVSVAGVCAISWLPLGMTEPRAYNWGLLAIALVSGLLVLLASQDRGWIFEIPYLGEFFRRVGKASYALYLSHMPAYFFLDAIFSHDNREFSDIEAILFTLGYALLLTALAWASHRFVEEPLRRYARKAS